MFVFVLYGGVIRAFGGIDLFVNVASKFAAYFKRGVPQVGVIASMFMGSLMGASVANVATTGAFTIPLMKRHGISGRTAGAIESIASTGGQILPPVMASVAFPIAQRVGIGLPIYAIPFIFLYRPELILVEFPGSLLTFLGAFVVLVVVALIAHSIHLAYTRKRFGTNA